MADVTILAKSAGAKIGDSNTKLNSLVSVPLEVPCYKGYLLKIDDQDKKKIWGGTEIKEEGTWVKDLQNDLISFGIAKYGLIVEHTTPRLPKIKKTVVQEPVLDKDGKQVIKNGKALTKKVTKTIKEPQPDKVDYWQKVTLTASGVFDKATKAALKLFQWHSLKVAKRIDVSAKEIAVSITFTGTVTGEMDAPTCTEMKIWKAKGYKIIGPALSDVPIKFDFTKFVELYESCPKAVLLPFIKLSDTRKANLQTLLNHIASDKTIVDIRWFAYMMATGIHECRSVESKWQVTWAPVEETPDGNDHYGPKGAVYGDLIEITDAQGRNIDAQGNLLPKKTPPLKARYYGRGLVQITWQDNYRKFDQLLSLNHELHTNPSKALEEDIAYKIMSIGMVGGHFIGTNKLSAYISGDSTDYFNARSIINTDKSRTASENPTIAGTQLSNGNLIKYYAEIFEWIAYNSLVNP
jgi:hypothetical protein